MKALSIRQPWAWLIVNNFKPVENRNWWAHYRGPLLIHAAKGITRAEYEDCVDLVAAIIKYEATCNSRTITIPVPSFEKLERGGVVGQTNLVDCVNDYDSLWFSGKFGFVLADAKTLPFRPYKGQLGFFDIPEAIAA